MPTALKIYCNCDTTDSPYGTSGVDWVEMDLAADYLVFSNGSDTVKDGEPLPSAQNLTQAGIIITALEQVVPHYFLADVSANLLKEIFNAGNQNKRYVFCAAFDGDTASEPVLEAWDDDGFDTVLLACLGAGTPTDSWYRGVTTTGALPGAAWVGSKLAGASSTHFLFLNDGNGALAVAGNLYFNFKVVVPASYTAGGSNTPVWCIKYCTD